MNTDDHDNTQYIPIPETYTRRNLNALYREIPLKDTVSRTMRKYFNAMAHLYGIITLEKAYEIISEQSPSLVSKDEFLAFAEIARHECEGYYILAQEDIYMKASPGTPFEREIIDVELFKENIDPYIQTKQSHQGKPYYIPPKKQLLLYSSFYYNEATPAEAALRAFLSQKFKLSKREEANVFQEILESTRYLQAEFTPLISRLMDMGLEVDDGNVVEQLTSLHQEFHNTTRMQCNRGFTPCELSSMLPPDARVAQTVSLGPNIRAAIANGTIDIEDLKESILTEDLPVEGLRDALLKEISNIEKELHLKKKIGRNDPCPCGSGKKYKKCCGR